MKSPVTLIHAFFTDVKRLDPYVQGLDRDFITIKRRFEHEGISFLTKTLVSLSDALDKGLECGTFDCPTAFQRKSKKGALPRFLGGLLSKVFEDTGFLKEFPDIHAIKLLRELCRMFKKFSLDDDAISKLEKETMRDFVDLDSTILPSHDDRMVHLLRLVAKHILVNSDVNQLYENPVFKHGPGSTLETPDINQKWEFLFKDLTTDEIIPYGFDDYLNGSSVKVSKPITHDSKLICVPKSSTSLRTISVESVTKQFIQQQLNSYLRDSIDRCRVLSRCLSLKDQSPNQKLAMIGSRDRSVATIDLSKASDRLSVDLVTYVFEHSQPIFLDGLLCSRSKTIKVTDKVIPLVKYAGMGNATTFPVQSVCYAVLCIAALHDIAGLRPTMNSCRRFADDVRVFGDDIIIPTTAYTHTTQWLEHFGLKVNMLKSYHKGNFRESCGCDAYNGVDVTPVYVRSLPSKALHTPSVLAAAVSASNSFWERGLYSTATVLSELAGKFVNLPLVSKNSGALGLTSRIDAMDAHKWDSKLHRLISKAIVPSSTFVKSKDISSEAKLLKCLLSPFESRMDPKHLLRYSKRFNTRLRKTWVPTEVGY